MLLHDPLTVITPTLDAQVLRVLASAADASFTGRQVARMIPNASTKGVRNVLVRLEAQGIIMVAPVGAANHYRLNDRHLAAPFIRELVRLKDALHQRISDTVAGWDVAPVMVALFGSAARSEMTEQSDIDLFVVRADDTAADDPTWEQQLDQLAEDVTSWTGNDARVLQMSAAEVREASERGDQIVDDVEREGIVLYGDRDALRGVLS